ncbi:N-acetylmuramoyl-L-alanine amidase [Acaryochloris sp. IP29b_bin.137]|uniref:N-acetylmuramoyl-L-alanine amidase n=1 Tax=Acaryochloris sp. IP29b_bin.137 TaxID=2969217 RepID=UPI0026115092|nr:N-acetylmuramoyl-L-alanine amidase [Acaryochloris sp. IP29b_bin.137]
MRHHLSSIDKQRRITHSVRWLLPSLCGLFLSCLPAEAIQLQSWRFDPSQNRLEFTTDEEIRPRVQLIPNPTRLVVDLPGIVLGQRTLKRSLGSQFRSVRLGQVNAQTARIVVELDPAYTLDPQQVKVEGSSPTNWSINLPTPKRWQPSTNADNTPQPVASTPAPLPPSRVQPKPTSSSPIVATNPSAPPLQIAQSSSGINDILVTVDGLFLPTKKSKPKVNIKRSRNKKEITFKISGTTIAPQLAKTFTPGYHGIKSMTFKSVSDSEAELLLTVDRDSPDWMASVSRFSGIVLLPKGGPSANRSARRPGTTVSLVSPKRPTPSTASTSRINTVRRIDLGGRQLLIQADQPISYSTRWSGRAYQITINSAKLADDLRKPRLGSGSPLSDITVTESDRDTVTILAKPSTNVRVTGVQRLSNQSIALNLLRPGQRPITRIPSNPFPSSTKSPPPVTGQPVRGRKVIVIDPGHGGPDPGAIGIGGLRETNVVLDISLEVSRILQRHGVVVYLTRTREVDVDLPPRVRLAERVRATAFVSIHANAISMSRPDVNGLETYHAPGARLGSRLARTVHNTILRSLRMPDRRVRAARFYVIRKTSMPAILVETGFLTGAQDIVRLRNPAWRKRMAQAIAQGILNYLNGRYN